MPEGDTIHKIASYLAPRLIEQELTEVTMADRDAARRCASRRIARVHARGKHLFIELDNGTALRSHLGMHGSWHRYSADERWKKPQRQASLVLNVAGDHYVCFNAKEIELVRNSSVRARIVDARLGPDLIADDIDVDVLVRRARDLLEPDALVADALLDQRIACGIGNVYKSEVLFLERLLPDLPIADVTDQSLARCYRTAADLLSRNLGGGARVTRFEHDGAGGKWVYGRAGQPCLRCSGRVETRRLGRHHRSTFWCPQCQASPEGPSP